MGSLPVIPAIARLLEMGALTTRYRKLTPEFVTSSGGVPAENALRYFVTPLGRSIMGSIQKTMNLTDPLVRTALDALPSEPPPADPNPG